ncbi:MAG: Ig-like domain-containing protein, partial [Actinomycetota bacterium]|nr:Ig-like domain-containing protein [Actinomycetota bacterium]
MSRTVCVALLALAALLAITLPAPAQTAGSTIVISEFRTRGPAGGNDEFVELRNRSSQAVTIGGYRLQGCASSGGNPSTRATIPAGVSLAPGQSYLFVNNASSGYSGPVAGDQTYGTGFTDFATGNQSGIRIVDPDETVLDGVGSPSSPCREGTGLVTPTSNGDNSFERAGGGTTDTNDNLSDFQGPKPGNPQNRLSTTPPAADEAPTVTSTTPPNGTLEVGPASNITVTFSEPVNATGSAFDVACNGEDVPVTVTSDEPSTTLTLDPDGPLPRGAECRVRVIAAEVTDRDTQDPPDNPAADHVFSFSTERITGLRIHDVQGRQHLSPYRDFLVGGVPGVVTAVRQTGSRGFYLQDPSPDDDPRTSEGIFVFVGGSAAIPPEV